MTLFNQLDFSGGLDAEFDRLKSPRNSYPLLINGRARDGNISGVRKHVRDTSAPTGIKQELVVIGDYLLLFVNGILYYKNIETNSPWEYIPSWVPMTPTADEYYTALVPVTGNVFNRVGEPNSATDVFNPQIAQTPGALFVTDGILQPRAVFEDLTWKSLQEFNQWSINNPEYVPKGILPTVSGVRLFLVSPDRKAIYGSVSGRYFDFVVNIKPDGNKGGDAKTMQVAVDQNDLTATLPITDGGLIATTLYAAHFVLPTGRLLFAEDLLKPQVGFPVGAVNHKSFVDVVGDTAFISQAGIQSINVARQIQTESNNFPLSSKIQRYLVKPQSETAAINYDDYALFAVNTTFGRGVFVFDTVRRAFVSFDTGFGTVKKFAIYRKAGIHRLFFINKDNELYEAYASDERNVTRILLGDFSTDEAKVQHKVGTIYAVFTGAAADQAVRASYYSDNKLVTSAEGTLSALTLVPAAPTFTPFVSAKETSALKLGVPDSTGYKSSLWLEWTGDASLVGVAFDGSPTQTATTGATLPVQSADVPIVFYSEPQVSDVLVSLTPSTHYDGLTPGNAYFVQGTVHLGDRQVVDDMFIAYDRNCYLDGTLYRADYTRALVNALKRERADLVLTGGNNTDATFPSYLRFASMFRPFNPRGAAGNLDQQAIDGEPWFSRHERYGIIQTPYIDFFTLNGDVNEPDGIDVDSAQAEWLRYRLSISTALYKGILIGYPPYTDGKQGIITPAPGYTALRWPFRAWGAHFLLSGHIRGYERFYVDAFPYFNVGTAGASLESFTGNNSVARSNIHYGYLTLLPSRFSLDIHFKDFDGNVRDATTIYPT